MDRALLSRFKNTVIDARPHIPNPSLVKSCTDYHLLHLAGGDPSLAGVSRTATIRCSGNRRHSILDEWNNPGSYPIFFGMWCTSLEIYKGKNLKATVQILRLREFRLCCSKRKPKNPSIDTETASNLHLTDRSLLATFSIVLVQLFLSLSRDFLAEFCFRFRKREY